MPSEQQPPSGEGVGAGRDLDVEVARVVFGGTVNPRCHGVLQTKIWNDPVVSCNTCGMERAWNDPSLQKGGRHDYVPPYSTQIAAAWTVVEHLEACCFSVDRENVAGVRYDATIYLDQDHQQRFHVTAATAPLAICRAALLALAAAADARPRDGE